MFNMAALIANASIASRREVARGVTFYSQSVSMRCVLQEQSIKISVWLGSREQKNVRSMKIPVRWILSHYFNGRPRARVSDARELKS
jgi:hypothetical protein